MSDTVSCLRCSVGVTAYNEEENIGRLLDGLQKQYLRDVEISEIIVVAITRQGEAFLPILGSEFRQGDLVQFAVHASAMERLESLLGLKGG